MSGATDAVVSMNSLGNAGGAAAAPAFAPGLVMAGGLVVAGAATYLVAAQMRSDYQGAIAEYQARCDRETASRNAVNAAYLSEQNKALLLAAGVNEVALADANLLFLMTGVDRIKRTLGTAGPQGDGGGPQGAGVRAAMVAQCDALLDELAHGYSEAKLAQFEKLYAQSAAWSKQLADARAQQLKPADRMAAMRTWVHEELALMRDQLASSLLTETRFGTQHGAIAARITEIEALSEPQAAAAVQGLELLRDRFRGEIRSAAAKVAAEAAKAARVRELSGRIVGNARAVAAQKLLPAAQAQAQGLLQELATLVSARDLSMVQLEALDGRACALFEGTETALNSRARAEYLQQEVTQVLASLGYRVTQASNADTGSAGEAANAPREARSARNMVAVLDTRHGVQLNIDGEGNLSGEMVAFSEGAADVDLAAQERVCDLMDQIFDGLRRRNFGVREKKRKNYKVQQDRLKVVKTTEADAARAAAEAAVARPREMQIQL